MSRRFKKHLWLVAAVVSLPLSFPNTWLKAGLAQESLELSGPEPAVPPLPSATDVDAPRDLPAGAEIMVTGPLHEAFAEQFSNQPEPGIVVAKKPPEAIEEVPPEYRPAGENIVWIPGYWGWDPEREDFLWVTGIWRQAPPDRNWVPGYWAEVPEGFQWIAGFWTENNVAEIRYLPTPPEPLSAEPSSPAPNQDHFWIEGQWTYVNNNYQWRAGYWTAGYPDWVWVPDRYVWTPLGCIFRPGYWDYVVPERGTVFCPVYYSQPVVVNYRLRPTYVVSTGPTLLANLFVCPRYHHYFFGNYYSSRYLGKTIYPWVTYTQQARRYDPLYGFYRNQYRDADYLNRLSRLHNYYATNVNYQPPRTLSAQREHHHELHDRQDLMFHALQLNKMATLSNDHVHGQPHFVRLAENERRQLERGLDPAKQLRNQRAEIEARVRQTNTSDDRGRRSGDNRGDTQDRRWSLPQPQDTTARLGSVALGAIRTPVDNTHNNRESHQNANREVRDNPSDRLAGDRADNQNRSREANNSNSNSNTINGNNQTRSGAAAGNQNATGRDLNSREPKKRDSNGRAGDNRNPIAREPLNQNPLGRNPAPTNANPSRNNLPGVNLPGVNLPGVNLPGNAPGKNLPGNSKPVNNSPRTNVPGTQVPGNTSGNNATGNNTTGKNTQGSNLPGARLSGSNDRMREIEALGLPGRSPALRGNAAPVPGSNPTSPSNRSGSSPKVPGSTPGAFVPDASKNLNRGDRGSLGRNLPGLPESVPGGANPNTVKRPGSAGVPGDTQKDLKQMREMTQRQSQRRLETPAPRRAPQSPNNIKPEKGKPEKGKDKS